MSNSNNKFNFNVFLIVLFIIIGFITYCISYKMNLHSEKIEILDINGNQKTVTHIDYPIEKKILDSIGTFSLTIALSIFIAVYISSQIEKKQKDKKEAELEAIRQAINVDVFDSLFKTLMPTEIYSVVKHQIIENKIIRRDVEWFYDFTENEEGNIDLKQTTKCKLHNTSRMMLSNPVKIVVQNEDQDICSQLDKAICTMQGNEILKYDSQNIDDCIGISNLENTQKRTVHNVDIDIPPQGIAELTLVFKNKYGKSVHDEHNTSRPLVNLNLYVNFPKNYEFSIIQDLSTELICTLKEETRHFYKAEGGILPFQGIVFFLKKKNGM